MNTLIVKKTKSKGKGVFTKIDISKGGIIEKAPVIVLPKTDSVWKHEESILDNYYYGWEVNGKEAAALALGYASLYNHSYKPNAIFYKDYEKEQLFIVALRNIKAGEEITINYNENPEDKSPVWFEVKT